MAVALTPLSQAPALLTGGRCLPRFDQWRPPVPRRVGELRPPPPTAQTGRNTPPFVLGGQKRPHKCDTFGKSNIIITLQKGETCKFYRI